MESGDCGNGSNLSFPNIFNEKNQRLYETNERETEDKMCNVSLKKDKEPRKVIHFSDGTIEEFSTDEDEPDKSSQQTREINPRTLSWGPWIWYHTANVGSRSLQVCDYLGEHLANFFGITTPKYQYEIDEYNRMMAEEEQRQHQEDLEMGGWTDATSQHGSKF